MTSPALGGLRAWAVFLTAATVYVAAVAARTSFAVAVPQAGARFPGGSSLLAMFVVLQLSVYALAQVPVGLLLDRFGSRRVLVVGAVIVGLGQLVMAAASSVPQAVLARVLVGAGDATAFIGVLRLLPAWFPLGRVPLMSQLAALIGATGQIVSAVPFLGLLHAAGWARAFVVAGLSVCVLALFALALVRDAPGPRPPAASRAPEAPTGGPSTPEAPAGGPSAPEAPEGGPSTPAREPLGALLRGVLTHPATWLGYFSHWVCMFPSAVLTLMWGVSWMTQGLGLPAAAAAGVITLNTVAAAGGGLMAGLASGRWPRRRPVLVVVGATAAMAGWVVGLEWPSPLVGASVCGLVLGLTAPVSGLGFDIARSCHPPTRWGTCTAVVNTGGFTATIAAVELVGVVLDSLGGARTDAHYDIAIGATAVIWVIGLVGLALAHRATQAASGRRAQA